jgi:hypothetical protein
MPPYNDDSSAPNDFLYRLDSAMDDSHIAFSILVRFNDGKHLMYYGQIEGE